MKVAEPDCLFTTAAEPTNGCTAEVTYSHTSLGPKGDDFVATFTEDFYRGFMRDWESRINHYLSAGTRLSAVTD